VVAKGAARCGEKKRKACRLHSDRGASFAGGWQGEGGGGGREGEGRCRTTDALFLRRRERKGGEKRKEKERKRKEVFCRADSNPGRSRAVT